MEISGKSQSPAKRTCSFYILALFYIFGMVLWFIEFPFRWIINKIHPAPDEPTKLKFYAEELMRNKNDMGNG